MMNDPITTREENVLSRTELLLGEKSMQKLARSSVLVFGLGGVGSYAAEALCRSGVGRIGLADHDRVSPTNLNRQLIATRETVGQLKTDVARRRILSIRPDCMVETYPFFYGEQTADQIRLSEWDYIVDAIDSVSSKLFLICQAQSLKIPIISCMGTGNKLDPAQLKVADLSKTSTCPLARVMRQELRKRGISHVKTIYSTEQPVSALVTGEDTGSRHAPGSVAWVPGAAGLLMAGEVIRDLTALKEKEQESEEDQK